MALPSQTARPTNRRSYMYSRRRSRRGPVILALIGLAVIIGGTWILLTGPFAGPEPVDDGAVTMSDPPDASTDTPGGAASGSSATQSRSQPAPGNTSGPVQIEMGSNSGIGSIEPQGGREPAWPPQPETTSQPPMAAEEQGLTMPVLPQRPAPTAEARRRALERMSSGQALLEANRPVEARRMLTAALDSEALEYEDEQRLRDLLSELSRRLVFSPEVLVDDPFARTYIIQQNDVLSALPRKQDLDVDWRLLQRINRIPVPERIRQGQRIKLITGPFHCVVHKHAYRMDVYLGRGDDWAYVRSFPVGLGEFNGTPVGLFRVRPNSKLMDPEWVSPRTGQRYTASDPNNPIGERWIGLEGVSEAVRDLPGYGIHGTIEPESIGRQSSLGCIRMLPADVEMLYEMLVSEESTVEIRED